MSGVDVAVGVLRARDLAQCLLDGMTERWRHTIAVARRAEELSAAIGDDDPDVLVAAAWLHDIGYAQPLRDSGFHPLDGAVYLDRHGWPRRISALVAHHSGACYVARALGHDQALAAYSREHSALADALTYADQTTGPSGQRMPIRARIADMLRRHGPDSPNARVHHLRQPHLLAIADRVEARLTHRLDPTGYGHRSPATRVK